jgi:hypothetical protein
MSSDDQERATEILRHAGLLTTTDPGVELLWKYDATWWWTVDAGTALHDLLRDTIDRLGRAIWAIRRETDAEALAQTVGVVCGTLTRSDASKSIGAAWGAIEAELRNLHWELQAHAALPWSCGRPGPVKLTDAAPMGHSWTPPVVQLLIDACMTLSPEARARFVPSALVCSAPEEGPRLGWLLRQINHLGGEKTITCDEGDVPEVAAALLAGSGRERGDWTDLLARLEREWDRRTPAHLPA